MAKLESYECIKCGGSGEIKAFSHYANGTCFACNGKGRVYHKPIERERGHINDTQYGRTRSQWLLTVAPEKFATLTHEQHQKARQFAYGCTTVDGGMEVYNRYRTDLEYLFFASQERVIEEYERENCPC